MATYKVIQDIEAEDKLVGPLSLKQFIYACIAATGAYLSFICVTKGAAFVLVVLGPITIFTGFFAFPWGRDQPTEIWALAKIRYFLKPRRRIWDQSGVKELVNITAPKHIERILTNNLTLTQVESRLNALATTLDSRGWAVKNVNLNLGIGASPQLSSDSDRLLQPSNMPQDVTTVDITAGDDILDEVNNPRAQQLEQMITTSTNSYRTKLMDQMRQSSPASPALPTPQVAPAAPQLPTPTADYWFLQKPLDVPQAVNPMPNSFAVAPTQPIANTSGPASMMPQAANPTPDEAALAEALRQQREKTLQTVNYQHMKVVQPLSVQAIQAAQVPEPVAAVASVTPPPDPATMELATRNDLTIATIANIANKHDEHPDEVVISLHNRSS